MDAIVPAAGSGRRLRPLTIIRPKPLVRIRDKPLLSYVFNSLRSIDVNSITVIVGYRGQDIIEYYGNSYRDVTLRYIVQDDQLGLGHAVGLVGEDPMLADRFAILNGDNFVDCDLRLVMHRISESGADGGLLVERASRRCAMTTGVVQLSSRGRIERVLEKPKDPPTNIVSAGFGIFPSELLSICRSLDRGENGEYELSDAISSLIDRGYHLIPVHLPGNRVNVNTPDDLERAKSLISNSTSQINK